MMPEIRPTQGDDERERPRPCSVGDRRASLAERVTAACSRRARRGRSASRFEGRVEDDRPDPTDDADHGSEHDPLAKVGRRPGPTAQASNAGFEALGSNDPITRSDSSSFAITRRPTPRSGRLDSRSFAATARAHPAVRQDRLADRQTALGQPRARRAGRSASSVASVMRPRRSSRRRRRLVAGIVPPTRAATSPTRPVRVRPDHKDGAPLWKRHLESRSPHARRARVVSPTMPIAIRSRSSVIEATAGAFAGVSWPVIVRQDRRLQARWLSSAAARSDRLTPLPAAAGRRASKGDGEPCSNPSPACPTESSDSRPSARSSRPTMKTS